ncbi:MAG: helix-turn-helix domain-containing protein [Planctomycetaceae bacterium]|nr:helix-turn-helix domain-containing protein [Planctomycetaceae bacterium]
MIYSKERRLEVLADAEQGMTTRLIALKHNCSESWVRRVKQEYREQGKVAPATKRKRIPKWHAIADDLQLIVQRHPDLTLKEIKQELGTELCVATICKALKALRLTLKKKS